jgi:hypothetical protein
MVESAGDAGFGSSSERMVESAGDARFGRTLSKRSTTSSEDAEPLGCLDFNANLLRILPLVLTDAHMVVFYL